MKSLAKHRIVWTFLTCVTVVITALVIGVSKRGITVTVTNKGDATISNVRLAFTGGSEGFSNLEANRSVAARINPIGESGLVLQFTTSQGEEMVEKADVYFERNYRGRINFTIHSDAKVKTEARIDLPLF